MAPRCRPAGGGTKPPHGALAEDWFDGYRVGDGAGGFLVHDHAEPVF